jgi:exopolysaccharide production protein ExoQ
MWIRLEKIFTVCALLFCAGAFIPLLSQQGQQISEDKPQNSTFALIQKQASYAGNDPARANRIILVGQILVYGTVAALLIYHRRQALLYVRNSKIIWAIVAFSFLSVFWSDVPGFAFRRCLNLTATCGLGLYLAFRYSPRQLLRLLGWTLLVAIVGSLLVVVLRPDLGIDSALTDYGWKGIFVQKNTLGRLMSFGVLVFLFLALDSKTHRRAYTIGLIACVFMILGSRSATSIIVVPVVLTLIWLFARSRKRSALQVFAVTIFAATGIISAAIVFSDPTDIFGFVGRDATLSGRMEIWSAVIPKIMVNPWLGYGYGSFWLGMQGQASADLWAILGWPVPHSHNGFLDVVEDLGVVGLGLFLTGVVISFRRGLLWSRTQREAIALWPLAYISFMLLFNITETSLVKQDNIFWVLYITTSVFVLCKTKELVSEMAQAQAGSFNMLSASPYAPAHPVERSVGLRWS